VPTPEAIKQRRQQLEALTEALYDEPIGPADPRYFPFHNAKGAPRGGDPISDLRATIDLSKARATSQLFSGFRGSGKSTELRRLHAGLVEDGYKVIFVEGSRVINLYQPLEPADLLLSVAAAVAMAVSELSGTSPAKRSLLDRIVEFFGNTNVNLSQLSVGAGVDAGGVKLDIGKLVFDLSTNPSFKLRVQDALRGRLSEFVEEFRRFMRDARELLGLRDGGRCPVLIVDDLEKVRGSGPDQDIVQKGMEQIFWEFNWALRVEGWHAIWTAPPYLQLLNAGITNQYDGCEVLPMIRVWENDGDRTPDPSGLDAVRRCLRKRGEIDSLFWSEALLDRLITASSGHLRDMLRLLQDVVRYVYKQSDPTTPLNEALIDRVLADYMGDCRKAIYSDDLPWLASVAKSKTLSLPNATLVPRVAKLLDTAVVMTYRNGSEWFDVCTAVQGMV